MRQLNEKFLVFMRQPSYQLFTIITGNKHGFGVFSLSTCISLIERMNRTEMMNNKTLGNDNGNETIDSPCMESHLAQ